jgi:hypothetical protein
MINLRQEWNDRERLLLDRIAGLGGWTGFLGEAQTKALGHEGVENFER